VRGLSNLVTAIMPQDFGSLRSILDAHERARLRAADLDLSGKEVDDITKAWMGCAEEAILDKVRADMGLTKVQQIEQECKDLDFEGRGLVVFHGPETKPTIREFYDRVTQATLEYLKHDPVPAK
jgi:hypothetical protein